MAQEPVVIPEKIYFKIGEVCELLDVQAHVLRYWETEFPMLSPQKNQSGQRSYRRRDVEMALRIKQLLYKEMFTIAGARKKLQSESRDGSRSKTIETTTRTSPAPDASAPTLFDSLDDGVANGEAAPTGFTGSQKDTIRTIAGHLLELRELLKTKPAP
ncbi:MAG: MerR family transcriptional regulator [Chloracidobacterium sp.]|nr:MerR family transcriptional regulator [Chloracidobacterium sp.]